MNNSILTAEQLEQWYREGFIIVRGLFEAGQSRR